MGGEFIICHGNYLFVLVGIANDGIGGAFVFLCGKYQ